MVAEVEIVGGVEVEEVVEVGAAKGGGLGATAVIGTSNIFCTDMQNHTCMSACMVHVCVYVCLCDV